MATNGTASMDNTTENNPSSSATTTTYQATIGSPSNFWLYSSLTGYDLTHPPTPTSPPVHPRLTLRTTTTTSSSASKPSTPITLSPSRTALLIIDMQNFFLSPAFNRNPNGPGHRAMQQISQHAVPAARKAGVQIVWVNWGLSEEEVQSMPPGVQRVFGFEAEDQRSGQRAVVEENGKNPTVYTGLGSECGFRSDFYEGDKQVDAGRLLMKNSWNAALYGPLREQYEEGKRLPSKPDVWIDKNRMSALWGARTGLEVFLEREGIRSLLFAGVNTDQCVGGTLQDAFSKGYDCVLLRDGAATSSPGFAQEMVEFNAGKSWGFVSSCGLFAEAVEGMGRE